MGLVINQQLLGARANVEKGEVQGLNTRIPAQESRRDDTGWPHSSWETGR